ncbi:MAG: DUF2244 domain-containing protein [Gammaproteobacteria bacterium]|nr:MAG: DUF2244 domain-containing protein [Gammaproteobacteria bacterium]
MHLFELSPNCSLTPGTATLFYLSILAVTLVVAGAFAVAGFWPVLLFAGLELLGLAAALHASLRRGRNREFIRIDERDVVVNRCAGRRRAEYRFARPWARVQLQAAPASNWPSRLLIGPVGRAVEVGAFLTESERRRLNTRLAQLLPPAPGALRRIVET